MRTRVVLIAAVALVLAWLLWQPEPPVQVAPSPAGAAAGDARPARATPASPPAAATATVVTRDEVAAEVDFVSESEDDGVVANAVRDGVAILVLGEDRQPRVGAKLRVRWRKGIDMYGHDRGVTDASGRFPTTVAEHEMLEGVTLTDPLYGDLYSGTDFLPMANDPRTVLCIVPQLHPLTVQVVDERGNTIASATVAVECVRHDAVQREFVLVPESTDVGVNGEGRAVLHVPVGTHEVAAKAEGHDAMYALRTEVPAGGRAVTVHLLSAGNRHDVAVTVVVAPELAGPVTIDGFTTEVPALPGLEPGGVEPMQVQFAGRSTGPRTFVIAAPPTPWRCIAHVNEVWGFAEVDAFATAVTVEVRAPPAKPVAKLRCKLLLPDGEETAGHVMVHTTPDLGNGSRYEVTPSSPFVAIEPVGRACVSAWADRYPQVVVGPIDLTAGEHDVVLQLVKPRSIRGRVVDEHGNPVAAEVHLLRPAGALRSLGDAVSEVLVSGTGTSEGGAFSFDDVGDGEHALYAIPEQRGWPGYVRVQPGNHDVVVRLGDGIDDRVRIQGRVTQSTTGAPIAGACVVWRADGSAQESYTDADGRYTVTLPAGTLHVTVMARRCAWLESDPAPFAKGLHTRDLVLTPSEPLFIRVRDEAGRVPRVEVLAFDGKGREIPFLDHNGSYDGDILRLDGNGRAELGGLPHTPLRLRLQTEDEDQSMDVDVPAAFVRSVDFPIVWKPRATPRPQPK